MIVGFIISVVFWLAVALLLEAGGWRLAGAGVIALVGLTAYGLVLDHGRRS